MRGGGNDHGRRGCSCTAGTRDAAGRGGTHGCPGHAEAQTGSPHWLYFLYATNPTKLRLRIYAVVARETDGGGDVDDGRAGAAEGGATTRSAGGGTDVLADTGEAAPLDRAAKQRLRREVRDKTGRKSKRRR